MGEMSFGRVCQRLRMPEQETATESPNIPQSEDPEAK